jgi:hypothetical protein
VKRLLNAPEIPASLLGAEFVAAESAPIAGANTVAEPNRGDALSISPQRGIMKRLCFALMLGVCFCAFAFSQDRGVIQCDSADNRIPVWTSPGIHHVVGYISCGQEVTVTGFDRGYARIQLGQSPAYVLSKNVRMLQGQEQAQQPPVFAPRSSEPAVPMASVYFGFSYLNFSTGGLTDARQNAGGWEASVSSNFNKWFALELDISGHYKNYDYYTGNIPGLPRYVSVAAYRDYTYLAGPRVNYGPVYIHTLFGGDRLSGSALGTPSAQTGFAGALGGGVQYPLNDRFAFRAGADYLFSTHNIAGGSSITNNNFRASLGIVFNLGSRRTSRY